MYKLIQNQLKITKIINIMSKLEQKQPKLITIYKQYVQIY